MELSLLWENWKIPMTIGVDLNATTLASIQSQMSGAMALILQVLRLLRVGANPRGKLYPGPNLDRNSCKPGVGRHRTI